MSMRVVATPKKVAVKLGNGERVEAHVESWVLALLLCLPSKQREEISTLATRIEGQIQTRREGVFLPDGTMPLR